MSLLTKLHALLPTVLRELGQPLDPEVWGYLHVTYEHPHIQRLFLHRVDGGRLFLHRLEPVPKCDNPSCADGWTSGTIQTCPACNGRRAMWHPHPWPSATLIVSGWYEMEVGDSSTEEVGMRIVYGEPDGPVIRVNCTPGCSYEMDERAAWHVVRPKVSTWSVMLTGEPYARPIDFPKPDHPGKRLPLTDPVVRRFQADWYYHLAISLNDA